MEMFASRHLTRLCGANKFAGLGVVHEHHAVNQENYLSMNLEVLLTGLSLPDVATLLLRCLVGCFFILARFRWFYDPSRPQEPILNTARHAHMRWRLCACGYSEHPYLSAFVACVEVSGGAALIVGLLTNLATMGLLCILFFATCCTAREKIAEQKPVDHVDCVSCYLWRVEGVYIAICVCVLLLGPGRYSIDWLMAQ